MSENTPTPEPENPAKGRPFFRRVLWRLFGKEGVVNTLPRSERDAQRLLGKIEDAVQAGSLSPGGLTYLGLCHLHLLGDGLDRLLKEQEKTNRLLGGIQAQNESIIGLLEDLQADGEELDEPERPDGEPAQQTAEEAPTTQEAPRTHTAEAETEDPSAEPLDRDEEGGR